MIKEVARERTTGSPSTLGHCFKGQTCQREGGIFFVWRSTSKDKKLKWGKKGGRRERGLEKGVTERIKGVEQR